MMDFVDEEDLFGGSLSGGGSLRGSALRSAVADAISGRPNHRHPAIIFVIIQSQFGLLFGAATWSNEQSCVQEDFAAWNNRPMQFSSGRAVLTCRQARCMAWHGMQRPLAC